MLKRFREYLTLVLIGLLPFHALLVTVGTKLILGPGHAPMTSLALWKEGLLAVILLIAFVEWLKNPKNRWQFDSIDLLIAALVGIAGVVEFNRARFGSTGLTTGGVPVQGLVYGIKYDFVPLIAFLALRRVGWSDEFIGRAFGVLVWTGVVIAGYGLIAMFLPLSWFKLLGYSDLHSLYLPDAPVAAFQQLEALGIRRMQSVMSGPNQLGIWMLMPWSLLLLKRTRRARFRGLHRARSIVLHRARFSVPLQAVDAAMLMLVGVAILMTFSRSAWVAAFVISAAVLHHKYHLGSMTSRAGTLQRALTWRLVMAVGGLIFAVATVLVIAQPEVFLRASSTRDHFRRPIEAVRIIKEHPFGLGLGSAGPASSRVSDTCVSLPEGSDALWAKDRPDLCVFVGSEKVQPIDRECDCPLLPENWYLQIGVELGVIGFAVYLALVFFIICALRDDGKLRPVFLAFLGVSIAALFLHAWEESATAYTLWMLAAAIGLDLSKKRQFP